jgi:hypothetical protein
MWVGICGCGVDAPTLTETQNKVGKALKGFGKLVSRAASAASKDKVDSTKYIKLLKGILDQTSVFARWIHYYDTTPNLGMIHHKYIT